MPHRRFQALQRTLKRAGDFRHISVQREKITFRIVKPGFLSRRITRAHLPAHRAQKRLSRIGGGAHQIKRAFIAQPARPTASGQGARRLQGGFQRRLQFRLFADQFLQAPLQPARARTPAFRAQYPTPQLRHLSAGQIGRKGAIGGVEKMVAFVKHQAQSATILTAAKCGLDHHQGMVGNHNRSATRAADGMFNEAFAIMRASSVDAFAAPISKWHDCVGAE